MADGNPNPQIDCIAPQDRAESLELVFSHLPFGERRRQIREVFAQSLSPDSRDYDGLIGASRNGRLVGAVFSQVVPGKTAIVWLPRLVADEPQTTVVQLYTATWEFLARQQVVLAQVLLSAVGRTEEHALRVGGFCHLASLLYLVSQTDGQESKKAASSCPFKFEPYCSTDHEQWAELLRATYEDSLDCSNLKDARNPEDVMAGYRSTGVFQPSHWLIARHEGLAVGCLLLADHPRQNSMELLYLGLVPTMRGRDWGKWLANQAKQLAQQAGCRRLVLAVDAANAPALQTYASLGFQTWQRRELFVKELIHQPLARIA